MDTQNALIEFRELFYEGLSIPHCDFENRTYFLDHFYMLEHNLSGLFYSIYIRGHCDYVFERNDKYWSDINNLPDFRQWCEIHLEQYCKRMKDYHPVSKKDHFFYKQLSNKVQIIGKLIDLACTIQKSQIGKQYRDDLSLTELIWSHFNLLITDSEKTVMHATRRGYTYNNITLGRLRFDWFMNKPKPQDCLKIKESLKHGIEAFRKQVRNRVLKDFKSVVVIKRCPECKRIIDECNGTFCRNDLCKYNMYTPHIWCEHVDS